MLFNSNVFVFAYLPLVFAGFFLVARASRRGAAAWLAIASLAFYGWWDWRYVPLLAVSMAFNYAVGLRLARAANRKGAWLAFGVTVNLVLLAWFKYADFLLGTVATLGGTALPALEIVLPLGISFYTFTQIAFLVDARRGIAREYDPAHYALFVTYFPHLIAGPVLHHKQMMPQFEHAATYRIQGANVALGLAVFTLGLAKKVLLADAFAPYASPVFDAARDGVVPPPQVAWLGAVAYALQLYFDFSGYSDMAIGLSLLFNVRLPLNFDSPYKAASIIDFWRRWHMSLSAFLRDYLYVPLGGNRHGRSRRYLNLMTTMVLGGLWHGASWTFVAWGTLHGLFLVVNHAWRALLRRLRPERRGSAPGRAAAVALTFLCVVVAWVFFRAEGFAAAGRMLAGMFALGAAGLPAPDAIDWSARKLAQNWAAVALGLALVWGAPNTQQWIDAARAGRLRWRLAPGHAVALGALLGLCLANFGRVSPFIYFQF